jgi:o-succinylbenzoate synthase
MSTVQDFSTRIISRDASSRLATTYGPAPESFPHVLVRLVDDEGRSGWGEASPLPEFTGETAASIQLALEHELLPALVGMEPGDIVAAHLRMDGILFGNSAAKAAADMALHDLACRPLGAPEYVLLGGRCRRSVGVNRHIGITSEEDAVRLALAYTAERYTTIKMKAGLDPAGDVRRVRAVRKAVGPDIGIRVDANQGYDLPTALRVLDALRDENLQFFEQPLRRADRRGLKTLREASGVPIAADESLHSVEDALVLAEEGCVDVFILKLIKTGGLRPALDIAGVARAAGIRCVVTSVFDTQLGAAHCLHLAAALPETLSCDLTCFASQPEMASTCHRLEDGSLFVGGGEGCGVYSLSELQLA